MLFMKSWTLKIKFTTSKGACKRLSKNGRVSICLLHCANAVAENTIKKLGHQYSELGDKFNATMKFFKEARVKKTNAYLKQHGLPDTERSLNAWLESQNLNKFHAMTDVRFRSKHENFVKLEAISSKLMILQNESLKFESLLYNIDFGFAKSYHKVMAKVMRILSKFDDDSCSSADLVHGYCSVLHSMKRIGRNARNRDTVDAIVDCVEQSIVEQVFGYKIFNEMYGVTNSRVPKRLTINDKCALWLFPPTNDFSYKGAIDTFLAAPRQEIAEEEYAKWRLEVHDYLKVMAQSKNVVTSSTVDTIENVFSRKSHSQSAVKVERDSLDVEIEKFEKEKRGVNKWLMSK